MRHRPLLLIPILTILNCGCSGRNADDTTLVKRTVAEYVEAINKHDIVKLGDIIVGSNDVSGTGYYSKNNGFADVQLNVTATVAEVTGDEAVAAVQYVAVGRNTNANERPFIELLYLKKSQGKWRVLPSSIARDSGTEALGKVSGLLNFYALALTKPGIFQQSVDKARNAQCLGNVRQLTLALIMYAQDNKQMLPPSANSYEKYISPYLKGENLFTCPLDNQGTHSYRFNGSLAGVNTDSIKYPAETVMVYEGDRQHLAYRHDNFSVVGFADGHVRLITQDQETTLKWKP